MAHPTDSEGDRLSGRIRWALAGAVAALTCVTWVLVVDVGVAFLRLQAALSSPRRTPTALTFEFVWQWLLLALSAVLIGSFFARPPKLQRAIAVAWWLALVVFFFSGLFAFGSYDLSWYALIPIGIAAGVVIWVFRQARAA